MGDEVGGPRTVEAKTDGLQRLKSEFEYFVPAYDWERRRWSAKVNADVLALRRQLHDAADNPLQALHSMHGLANKPYLRRWLQRGGVDSKTELDSIWAGANVEQEQDIPQLYLYSFGDSKATVPKINASSSALARIYNLYRCASYNWDASGLNTGAARSKGLSAEER